MDRLFIIISSTSSNTVSQQCSIFGGLSVSRLFDDMTSYDRYLVPENISERDMGGVFLDLTVFVPSDSQNYSLRGAIFLTLQQYEFVSGMRC
jgi:hypothetical protein